MKFRHIDILNVSLRFKKTETLVGKLATKDGRTYFEYDARFMESGIQISPFNLPLKSGLIRNEDTTFDGLFGVFNDSLPDGWGKLLIDRAMRDRNVAHQSLTALDRLSFVGKRGMGALIYSPEQHFETQEIETIKLDAIAQDVDEVLKGSVTEVIERLQAFGGSSAGARPKILVGYDRNTNSLISGTDNLPAHSEPWIIKFPSSSDPPDIAQIEYAYALMAKAANVEMTETQLFSGNRGRYFGTSRFDRQGEDRLHTHTAAGLLHSSHRYPSLDYSDLMNRTLYLTHDHRELEKVFKLCCFNVLAHNRDDHSKNFSFLMNEIGNWTFAPAYDLTFSFGPGGQQSTTVMGEGQSPKRSHLSQLAAEFNLKKYERVIDEVENAISNWATFASEANVSPTSKKLIAKYLSG
ncbi:MAG: serine/threonine-protein kinase HipA [Granulosicoccus sp.]|jgi:serine/threonine-protein kinase HipA